MTKKKMTMDELRKLRPSVSPQGSPRRKRTNGKKGSILGESPVVAAIEAMVPPQAEVIAAEVAAKKSAPPKIANIGGTAKLVPQKRKRGRPKGSKNKPKPPPKAADSE